MIYELLKDLLRQYQPDMDVDSSSFDTQVLSPIRKYLHDGIPETDITAMINQSLAEEFPDADASVLADLCGRVAALMVRSVSVANRTGISKRRLDDAQLVSLEDMRDTMDALLIDPVPGSRATGVVRALYPAPRTVSIPTSTQIVVTEIGGTARRFFPQNIITLSVDAMRENTASGMYYVDIPVVSASPGAEFNISRTSSPLVNGVPGAARMSLVTDLSNGSTQDTPSSYLARIASGISSRTIATPAGAEYALQGMEVGYYDLVTGGDPRLLRDAVFAPGAITSMPGWMDDVYTGDVGYVHIGITWDLYVTGVEPNVSVVQVEGLATPGSNANTIPIRTVQATLEQLSSTSWQLVFSADIAGMRDRVGTSSDGGRQVSLSTDTSLEVGSFIEMDVLYDATLGRTRAVEVDSITDSTTISVTVGVWENARLEPFDGQTVWVRVRTSAIAAVSPNASVTELAKERIVRVDGTDWTSAGRPVEPDIRGVDPLIIGGSTIPQTIGYIRDPSNLPVTRVDRAEIVDEVTGQPSGKYGYPAHPMFVEYLGLRKNASGSLSGLSKIRVHLLGPAASSVTGGAYDGTGTVFEVNRGDLRFSALRWPSMTATVISSPLGVIESARLSVTLNTGTLLTDWNGNTVYEDDGSNRALRVGDHVCVGDISYPISSIIDATTVEVYARDLLVGTVYSDAYFAQGTSWTVQTGSGRGDEGTWFYDVFVAHTSEAEDAMVSIPSSTPMIPDMRPFYRGAQGYSVVYSWEGFEAGAYSPRSLVWHSPFVADSTAVYAQGAILYGPSGSLVTQVQDAIDAGSSRPLGNRGLAKQFSAAYVTYSAYYEADSLTAEEAANAIADRVLASQGTERIEESDLRDALTRAGATYSTTGRMFVMKQDHLGRWTYQATRGQVALSGTEELIPYSIRCVRLPATDRRGREDRDDYDPTQWLEQFTRRHGGFSAD